VGTLGPHGAHWPSSARLARPPRAPLRAAGPGDLGGTSGIALGALWPSGPPATGGPSEPRLPSASVPPRVALGPAGPLWAGAARAHWACDAGRASGSRHSGWPLRTSDTLRALRAWGPGPSWCTYPCGSSGARWAHVALGTFLELEVCHLRPQVPDLALVCADAHLQRRVVILLDCCLRKLRRRCLVALGLLSRHRRHHYSGAAGAETDAAEVHLQQRVLGNG